MTMLKLIIAAMRRDVLSPRHRGTFETWQTSEPCLEPFANVEALLSALEDNHEESYPIREALTLLPEVRSGRTGEPVDRAA